MVHSGQYGKHSLVVVFEHLHVLSGLDQFLSQLLHLSLHLLLHNVQLQLDRVLLFGLLNLCVHSQEQVLVLLAECCLPVLGNEVAVLRDDRGLLLVGSLV